MINKEPSSSEFANAVKEIESAIIRKDYTEAASELRPGRLSRQQIEDVFSQQTEGLTPAPQIFLEQLTTTKIKTSLNPQWFVDFALWINGRESDLTLSLLIEQGKNGSLRAGISDIHTL